MATRQWIVSQIGAREHYAVPRALEDRNRLARLYTDAWCRYGHAVLRKMPDPLRSYANRYHPAIPSSKVKSFDAQALWKRLRWQFASTGTRDEQYFEHHRSVGQGFARAVRADLEKRGGAETRSVFFGYNTAVLEVLEMLSSTACTTLVDQIDPGRREKEIVIEEAKRWPEWTQSLPEIYEPYEQRLRDEWSRADGVIVNSEWSKQLLEEQNVSADKIHVVPLAYEPPEREGRSEGVSLPLNVLWLGTVNLRKGIPYLVEAARQLTDVPVRFRIVGPIRVAGSALTEAPSNMEFTGRVPRDDVAEWYRRADVFVLPTLSDGFAITQLEAMAHGLPVIATPNCGRVVTEGEDGHIVPPRDAGALVRSLTQLVQSPDRVAEMGGRAYEKAQTYTLDRVADRLTEIVSREG